MSERRRFFPATPVQQVPGRTVELEMQLRPEAPVVAVAPAPPDPGGLVAASWLPHGLTLAWMAEPGGLVSAPAGDLTNVTHSLSDIVWSHWAGEPVLVDGAVAPLPGHRWRCEAMGCEAPGEWRVVHVAVLWGAPNARWQLTWDAPGNPAPVSPHLRDWAWSAAGELAHAESGCLTVRVGGSGFALTRRLTAVALDAGVPVAKLQLEVQ